MPSVQFNKNLTILPNFDGLGNFQSTEAVYLIGWSMGLTQHTNASDIFIDLDQNASKT